MNNTFKTTLLVIAVSIFSAAAQTKGQTNNPLSAINNALGATKSKTAEQQPKPAGNNGLNGLNNAINGNGNAAGNKNPQVNTNPGTNNNTQPAPNTQPGNESNSNKNPLDALNSSINGNSNVQKSPNDGNSPLHNNNQSDPTNNSSSNTGNGIKDLLKPQKNDSKTLLDAMNNSINGSSRTKQQKQPNDLLHNSGNKLSESINNTISSNNQAGNTKNPASINQNSSRDEVVRPTDPASKIEDALKDTKTDDQNGKNSSSTSSNSIYEREKEAMNRIKNSTINQMSTDRNYQRMDPSNSLNSGNTLSNVGLKIGCYDYTNYLQEKLVEYSEDVLARITPEIEAIRKLQGYADKAEAIRQAYESWNQTNAYYKKWKDGNYESLTDGVNFARQMGQSMASLESFIPVPQAISEYMGCLFKVIPLLINAYTDILVKYAKKIDESLEKAESAVKYHNMKCSTNGVKPAQVDMIDGMNIPEYKKDELFQASCAVGFAEALKRSFTK